MRRGNLSDTFALVDASFILLVVLASLVPLSWVILAPIDDALLGPRIVLFDVGISGTLSTSCNSRSNLNL
jgi:hypothetical protein